jgi:hypothetical protein
MLAVLQVISTLFVTVRLCSRNKFPCRESPHQERTLLSMRRTIVAPEQGFGKNAALCNKAERTTKLQPISNTASGTTDPDKRRLRGL